MCDAAPDPAPKGSALAGCMKAVIIGALAVGALSSPAAAAETIAYGSRAGMEVTVTSKSGIGGRHAVIRAGHTRGNAKKFCL